jgi:galactokinase
VNAVAGWFRRCYGGEPAGVWRAPGRVNFIGEHTDYNDGLVMPFAIAAGVSVAAAPRDDGMLELASAEQHGPPVAVRLAGLEPGAVTGWAAYVCGVAWALREAGHPVPGARLAFGADLPAGAGLSSSAALECAAALALTGLTGAEVPRPELVRIAQRAENGFAGVPSGILDQSASLLCREGHALLLDCLSGDTEQLPFEPAACGAMLLVIDTGVRHEHAGGEYARRRAECDRAARLLGLGSLRELSDHPGPGGLIAALGDPVLARRAAHVVSENRRVAECAGLLRSGGLSAAAALLTASHQSLRDDYEVSWPAADATVEAATGAGALGARMIGGGFGGSVLAMLPAGRDAAVRAAVTSAFRARGWNPPVFREVSPSAGAHRIR